MWHKSYSAALQVKVHEGAHGFVRYDGCCLCAAVFCQICTRTVAVQEVLYRAFVPLYENESGDSLAFLFFYSFVFFFVYCCLMYECIELFAQQTADHANLGVVYKQVTPCLAFSVRQYFSFRRLVFAVCVIIIAPGFRMNICTIQWHR